MEPSDTLASVAAHFDITPSELAILNRLPSRTVFPGQVIRVPDKRRKELQDSEDKENKLEPDLSQVTDTSQEDKSAGHEVCDDEMGQYTLNLHAYRTRIVKNKYPADSLVFYLLSRF